MTKIIFRIILSDLIKISRNRLSSSQSLDVFCLTRNCRKRQFRPLQRRDKSESPRQSRYGIFRSKTPMKLPLHTKN